ETWTCTCRPRRSGPGGQRRGKSRARSRVAGQQRQEGRAVPWWPPFSQSRISRALGQISERLASIDQKESSIMSGLDDLNAAVATLQGNVTALENEQAQFILDIQQALQ